jgi:hypothetical protein
MKRLALNIVVLVAVVGIFGGCGQVATDSEPVEQIVPQSGQFVGDAMVKIYGRQPAPYYTQQEHLIGPNEDMIAISSNEPEGMVEYKLVAGYFSVITTPGCKVSCEYNRQITQAILSCFSAGAGFEKDCFKQQGLPVKIDGQEYRILCNPSDEGKDLTVRYFENPDTWIIERVTIANTAGDIILAIGYNHRNVKKLGRSAPTKIDVYNSNEKQSKKQLLMQIDYKSLEML